MAVAAIFVIVGTVIGLLRALPQLVRLLRTRRVQGVSADTAATISVVSAAWATYGVLTDQLAVALASGATSLMFGLVTVMALRFGRRLGDLRTAPIWLVVLAVGGVVGGAASGGIVLLCIFGARRTAGQEPLIAQA